MKNALLFICMVLVFSNCSLFKSAVSTLPEIARTLCMLAASERSNAERIAQSDESWCVDHAVEYIEAIGNAERVASKKAGLRR